MIEFGLDAVWQDFADLTNLSEDTTLIAPVIQGVMSIEDMHRQLMRLTYLAPDIVRALVVTRLADGLTPAGLLTRCKDLSHDWQLQRAVLGLETR